MWRGDSWEGGGLLGVDDRLNRSVHAPHRGQPSSSPLRSIMGPGSLKWVATAKCIIFEMLSHKASWPHLQLCLMLFMSPQLLFAVSNCLPPASKMSCQPWTGFSFVCQGKNRLGVTTSKKEEAEEGGKMAESAVHTGSCHRGPFMGRLSQRRGLNSSKPRFPLEQMGIQ